MSRLVLERVAACPRAPGSVSRAVEAFLFEPSASPVPLHCLTVLLVIERRVMALRLKLSQPSHRELLTVQLPGLRCQVGGQQWAGAAGTLGDPTCMGAGATPRDGREADGSKPPAVDAIGARSERPAQAAPRPFVPRRRPQVVGQAGGALRRAQRQAKSCGFAQIRAAATR
jgi:hypothetical protein